jgi:filamentous hemagglutinin family protein
MDHMALPDSKHHTRNCFATPCRFVEEASHPCRNDGTGTALERQSAHPAKLAWAVRAILAGGLVSQGAYANGEALPVPSALLPNQGASYAAHGLEGVVTQSADKAILNWQSFNIGPQNTVRFVQPQATSIAFNRIHERVNPSQILGTLTANGQVYLYNPNGFVFGKNSQVNVNALVATTLDVTDQVFERGITKVFDQNQGQAAFQWTGEVLGEDGRPVRAAASPTGSRIAIEPGAKISTNAPNRRILIVAPVIDNQGQLKADDGEIILAAAQDKLYLQEAPADSEFSGLLVEVSRGGLVNNAGDLAARRGAITLMGFAVNQNNRVSATTSVTRNGTIRLLAREGGSAVLDRGRWRLQPGANTHRAGAGDDGLGQVARVTLGEGSVTEVHPEYGDAATAVDEQAQPQSRVEIVGKQVRFDSNARVVAPSGKVTVTAVDLPARVRDTRIDMAKGSRIDVAGLKNVSVAMERNVVELTLRGNELRDAPLQRHGPLRGQTVSIDVRKGTAVADVSAALRRVGRTVEERSTAGGGITLTAPGAVVVNDGATLDISGGAVNYRDGYVKTTQLLQPGGRAVDIGDADPNVIYRGILSRPGRFERGYVEGKDGGMLDIRTEALHLMGQIAALTQAGARQRTVASLPRGSELAIDLTANTLVGQDVRFRSSRTASTLAPNDPFPGLASGGTTPAPLVMTPDVLRRTGLRTLSIKTSGRVDVPAGLTLTVPDAGGLSLTGGELSMGGVIDAPGGVIELATEVTGRAQNVLSGALVMKSGGRVDAGGVWVNDARPHAKPDLINIDGGSIDLRSQGDLTVEKGSELAADGGAWLQSDGRVQAGKGGHIALESTAYPGRAGSNLTLEGAVHAFALDQGGTLSLATNQVVIGGRAPSTPAPGGLRPLVLPGEFFAQGGFSAYTVTSNLNGVTVAGDSRVGLKGLNLFLNADFRRRENARSLNGIATTTLLPDHLRRPVDLTLAHRPPLGQLLRNSGVVVEAGARIEADPKARVSLVSDGNIEVHGAITTRGGAIDLTILAPEDAEAGPTFSPSQGIFLGGTAHLDASGVSRLRPDPFGFRTGELLAGGRVDLRAERGYIVAERGSRIDVAGASDRYQLAASRNHRLLHGGDTTPTRFDSNGGTIRFVAAEGVLLDGELRAGAGGPRATGGSLHIELDKTLRNEHPLQPFPPNARVLEMRASTALNAPVGWAPGQDLPLAFNGVGRFSSTRVREGEFAALTLKSNDEIVLRDGQALALARRLVLDAPVLGWAGAAGTADLRADYLAIGSTLSRHVAAPATAGPGTLSLSGRLIELVGAVSLKGYSATRVASAGDLRLRGVAPDITGELGYRGEFETAGDLTLEATRIYPTTASAYHIDLTGASSMLRIEGAPGSATPVLSAGGRLTLRAPRIAHGGTLMAPFGSIDFVATDTIRFEPGSLTSVSGKGLLVPFGRTPGGIDWLYPMVGINNLGNLVIGNVNLVFAQPPAKAITLGAPDIDLAAGATIDIAGGGDLHAFEFAAGLGGSMDVLDPRDPKVLRGEAVYEPKFAVLPAFQGGFAPYDHLEFPVSGLNVGDSVHLSGVEGLPAGEYALLPAHYALLPGAFLVTPKAGYSDIQPGQSFAQTDGARVIAGFTKTAGTAELPVAWSAFAVEPGSAARTRSEYKEHLASSTFFEEKARKEGLAKPASVFDAGSLTLAATRDLRLGASISAAPLAGGRGGQLDIVARNIAVMTRDASAGFTPNGLIALVDEDLRRLGVESLGLGTSRTRNRDGSTQLRVEAERVTVQSGARLQGQEILLAAKEAVTVADGAELDGRGAPIAEIPDYRVDGDAALLRVSSGAQAGYRHSGEAGAKGDLDIQAGAVVRAQGSMLLDASRDTRLNGGLFMTGGDLAIKAGSIHLGSTPVGASGAVLSDPLLAGLDVDNLALTSRSAINFHGKVDLDLGNGNAVLDAGALAGFGASDEVVAIRARSIRLAHGSDTPVTAVGNGQGGLRLDADRFEFGAGDYAISGFSAIELTGRNDLTFSGQARVGLGAATRLSTARVSGADSARLTLDASGHGLSLDRAEGRSTAAAGLGARFDLVADHIDFGARLDAPSGVASFTALQGDVNVAPGAQLDLSGRYLLFAGNTVVRTPGGWLTFMARSGDIHLSQGAEVNLAAGGILELHAAGDARIDAGIEAGAGGTLAVDARSFGAGGFSVLNEKARAGGFDGDLVIRQRSGDLTVASTDEARARHIDLSADAGSLRVEGTLDASGAEGGGIRLSAGEQVVLESGAKLRAMGTGGAGGRVELASARPVASSDEQQGLRLQAGSSIDLSGTAGGGELHLRARRDDRNVSIAPIATTLAGVGQAVIEAVKVEDVGAASAALGHVIDLSQIASWQTQTAAFMTHAETIAQALGGGVTVRPGLEVRGAGDLTLDQTWDLLDWRYAVGGRSVPGYLTLRAGGDVGLNQSISDGFDVANTLQAGDSWTVRVVAGADQGSADWRSTVAGTGDVNLARGAMVRTGTGDLEIRAGNDVVLQHQTSAIYTAGRIDPADRYGNLDPVFRELSFPVEYPIGGGDVTVVAGGNIEGAQSDQLVSDWLLRMGNFDGNVSAAERERAESAESVTPLQESPTAWGIRFDFQQNVGALGGGDVNVAAGGVIRNLQVILPTTGKQKGRINPNAGTFFETSHPLYITNEVEINGGGDLAVIARGDILGGQFLVDRGQADIVSFGSIGGGDPRAIQFETGPWFAIGDAPFRVRAAGDIDIGAAYNPFAFMQKNASRVNAQSSTFIGYTEHSALNVYALAGDIDFRIDPVRMSNEYTGLADFRRGDVEGLRLLPGTVEAVAARGDITLSGFHLFPAARGNLALVAGGDIQSNPGTDIIIVNLSDADPALFPSAKAPASDLESAGVAALLNVTERDSRLIHAARPVHLDDPTVAWLISQNGSIDGRNNLKLYLSKPAYISAGVDVRNIGLNIQNLRPGDFSIIQTGRDLRYDIGRGDFGQLLQLQGFGVRVDGPGQLHVLAGRDIDLGASDGIVSTGNLVNPALHDIGASLTLLAGLTRPPAYEDFLEAYFAPGKAYRLDADGKVVVGPAPDRAGLELALSLPEELQRELVLLVFFNELKLSSQEAAAGKGYRRGADAIARLFPGDDYQGDIELFFSRIHTLDGGNIDLLAPGGLINVGLASAFVGDKKPDELGVVAQRGGAVRTYSRGDLQVNQSRVFALAGKALDYTPWFSLFDIEGRFVEPFKDLIAWSAVGNIDAGRGGRSLSVSTGKKGFDQNGNWTDEVPPTISGSGARAVGDVYLAAPEGVIDAAEAGIAGNRVTIAATAIIGASNIQTGSGGLTTNVPTAPAAPAAAPAGAAGAAAAAARSAETFSDDTGKSGEDKDQANRKNDDFGMLSVDLVGFGECSVGDIRAGKAGCG